MGESIKELDEIFETFLFNMDDRLERLEKEFSKKGNKFDFSMDSLNFLEDFILENNIDKNHELYDDVACYIGEVVRKNYGGKWECCFDLKENSFFYGMPVISGFNNFNVLLCPYDLLRVFLFRKKRGLLIHSIELDINPPKY